MKKTLCSVVIFIISTVTFAADASAKLQNLEPVPTAPISTDKSKKSLIKQSVKKANINEEVDTQALKLGGIHRREDAREYLELRNDVEKEPQQQSIEKAKVKNTTEEVASK
ncbi:hypothetical protein MXM33_04300 [Acinetobacter vivianii]|uniref:hypothetical protein n=1 Tax=Acinetobacter vivianii TaxID=1776742 RepID=UPI002DB8B23D|nr:hypothetical protein [Acinetobacter vivianii]MEB6666251.1 hypothetical protein [Acinetobacter vivianii]